MPSSQSQRPQSERIPRAWHLLAMSFLIAGEAMAAAVAALPPPGADVEYVVRDAESLARISRRLLNDGERPGVLKALQKHNGLGNANRIRPRQVVRVPVNWLRTSPDSAEIIDAEGDVRSAGLPVSANTLLHPRAAVQTGADGRVQLKLTDGSTLWLSPDSTLAITRLHKTPISDAIDAAFELRGGQLRANVPARDPGLRFDVRALRMTASMGTGQFRIGIDDASRSVRVESLQGSVELSATTRVRAKAAHSPSTNTGEKALALAAGLGTRITENRPPRKPRPLLAAPAPWGNGLRLVNRRPNAIAFDPIAGASRYRITVITGSRTLSESVTDKPEITIDEIPNGAYSVNVRAIDADGIEGHDWRGRMLVRVPD